MAERKKLTDSDIKAIIQSEIANCDGQSGSELANERAENLDYYFARPFGNEQDGRSQVVVPDVRNAVEWIMPTLMRIFTSGENVVEFEPQEEKDVQAAKQATEYANFIWNRDNEGYKNFETWFKDGLISKVGVVKIYYHKSEKENRERFSGLDDATFATIVNDKSVTVAEHTETQSELGTLHDVVVTYTKPFGKVCVDPVPPEEFLISKDARSIAEARFVGHKRKRTLSDLIEEGFPANIVNNLSSDDRAPSDQESIARDTVEESVGSENTPLNKAMREVWVYEGYAKVDVDGDGIAEMRQVTAAGPGYEILRNESWDAPRPFVSLTPIILPHRFVGLAIADITKIWQKVRSTIFRQYLDNLYLSNNQREEVVASDVVDPAEALSHVPGQKIRVKRSGTIVPIQVPQIGAAALEGMNYVDQVKENDTGVSQRTQGLGSNKLHETAKGEQMLMSAAMGKIELIARNYAEGVREAFKLIHKLVCMYQDQPRVVRLTGKQFVPVDPSQWNADMDMTVSVGLGTGDKDQQMQAAMVLGQAQAAIAPYGMVKPEHMLNTMEMLVNATGQKGVDRFASLPDPNAPPKPDPEMAKVQAQAEADKAKAQMDGQIKTAQLQQDGAIKQQQTQADAALEQQKMAQEFQLKQWQIEQEMALKERQLVAELQLKERQLQAELAIKRELGLKQAETKVNSSDVHPGGEPG